MNIQTIIVISIIAAAVVAALRIHRRSGGCHGRSEGCAGCTSCSGTAKCSGKDCDRDE